MLRQTCNVKGCNFETYGFRKIKIVLFTQTIVSHVPEVSQGELDIPAVSNQLLMI